MNHQACLLFEVLDGHEAHVWALNGFADRGGVGRIVLAALARHPVGGDELGRDQPHGVARSVEQPGPMVAPEQASMPTTHGGRLAMSSWSLSRGTFGRTSSALPASLTP